MTIMEFQSLLGKIIGSSSELSRMAPMVTFQSLLGKIIVEYFATYPILYTTSCVCQGFLGEKTVKILRQPLLREPKINLIPKKIAANHAGLTKLIMNK